jgi:type VII secretion-associated serine protease mycosin
MRRAGPLSILLVLAAAVPLAPSANASAHAPTCAARTANSPGTGTLTETPWAQARLGTDRLATLATGEGVTVAVIDSGVDRANRALGRVLGGGDLLDPDGDGRLDCVGHGTAIASLINGAFHGVAPRATVLSIRVTEQEEVDGATVGRTSGSAGLATAIRNAVDQGADVINLSLVSYTNNAQVRTAVADAVAHDVVVVAAVGNRAEEGNPTPYPAAYDGVLGVGAVDMDGKRLPSSQIGAYVDLVAPGAQIVAAGVPDGFTIHEGTSFATPFVAAAAALVREYRPKLTAAQVVERLRATADGPESPEYGRGLVNPYRALTDQLIPTPSTPPPPIAERQAVGGPRSSDRQAFKITGAALGLTLLAVLVGVTLHRGNRRRWRPGLTKVPSTDPRQQPDPPSGQSRSLR